MQYFYSLIVALLFGFGVYLLLRRSLVKMLFAFMLIGSGANLLLFFSGRLVRGRAPLAHPGQMQPEGVTSDPLAQALILTAIVISFGVLIFAMVLVKRQFVESGTEDLDLLDSEERT
jgi:multicomponent Na+:H+ antiporter subunit C